MSIQQDIEKKMKLAIDHLKDELKKIRTGQANPAMVENVLVEVYGASMRLRDAASITSPEPRQLLISPFDPSNTAGIGKSLEKANLGFKPIVEANVIRINIPPMDESIRKEMVKMCHQKREDSKISIRNIRREGNELARKQKTNGDIGEDMEKKIEKSIQELTDKYCKEADACSAQKEKEVSTI